MVFPTVEQDLELFEKPPPIEPAATISSMGEVAAAVQEAELTQPPPESAPQQPAPFPEQFVPSHSSFDMPPPLAATQPETPVPDVAPPSAPAEPQPEQSPPASSPMDLLAKLLRGESAHPDGS